MRQIFYNPLNHLFYGKSEEGWWTGCEYYRDAHRVNLQVENPPFWILDQLQYVDRYNLGDYAAQPVKWRSFDPTDMCKSLWYHHPHAKFRITTNDWT